MTILFKKNCHLQSEDRLNKLSGVLARYEAIRTTLDNRDKWGNGLRKITTQMMRKVPMVQLSTPCQSSLKRAHMRAHYTQCLPLCHYHYSATVTACHSLLTTLFWLDHPCPLWALSILASAACLIPSLRCSFPLLSLCLCCQVLVTLDTGDKAQLGVAVELAQLDVFRVCKIVNTATDFLGGCHLQSDLALSSLEVIRSWLCSVFTCSLCGYGIWQHVIVWCVQHVCFIEQKVRRWSAWLEKYWRNVCYDTCGSKAVHAGSWHNIRSSMPEENGESPLDDDPGVDFDDDFKLETKNANDTFHAMRCTKVLQTTHLH